MEEKLYFKPGNYGKGRKKKQTVQKLGNVPEKKDHKGLKIIFLSLLLLVVIVVIIWLLHGKTITTGQYPENVKNEALICESSNVAYDKFKEPTPESRNMKINLIFNNDKSLKSIAVIYTMFYETAESVTAAEAFTHAEFNLGLNAIGYDSEKFDNKFTRYDKQLIFSIFGSSSVVNEYNGSYFMIKDYDYDFPKTIREYQTVFEKQGFSCTTTEDNN